MAGERPFGCWCLCLSLQPQAMPASPIQRDAAPPRRRIFGKRPGDILIASAIFNGTTPFLVLKTTFPKQPSTSVGSTASVTDSLIFGWSKRIRREADFWKDDARAAVERPSRRTSGLRIVRDRRARRFRTAGPSGSTRGAPDPCPFSGSERSLCRDIPPHRLPRRRIDARPRRLRRGSAAFAQPHPGLILLSAPAAAEHGAQGLAGVLSHLRTADRRQPHAVVERIQRARTERRGYRRCRTRRRTGRRTLRIGAVELKLRTGRLLFDVRFGRHRPLASRIRHRDRPLRQ